MELLLFLISSLPVLVIGYFVYNKDKNKENHKLLLKLFIGGLLSFFLVLIISSILYAIIPFFAIEQENLNLFQLIISVFIGIALVEEFSKLLMTYLFSYNKETFDEKFDGIIYGVFVALGFAFIENLFYVYTNGFSTGLLRAVTSVPLHACAGIFMGYYLSFAKLEKHKNNKNQERKYLILSLLIPTFIHGLYNYLIFTQKPIFIVIFFILVIVMYVLGIKKINHLVSINRKIVYKDKFCSNCGSVVDSDFCPRCGKKHD